jgi:hypothetical protein
VPHDREARWTGEVRLNKGVLADPYHCKKPRRVFASHLPDLFHEKVSFVWIMNIWRIMGENPKHTFQVLTKRPERMLEFVRLWSDVDHANTEFHDARGPEEVRKFHKDGLGQLFADMIESWGTVPKGSAYPTYDWMKGTKR